MIITEAMFPTKTGGASHYIGDEKCLPRLTELTDLVHGYGTKICAQMGAGSGRIEPITPECPNPPSASAIPAHYTPNVLCHELTVEEIRQRVEVFTPAAKRMVIAGFDEIEIPCARRFIFLDQFMSCEWNKRTDEYGGSIEKQDAFTPALSAKSHTQRRGPEFPHTVSEWR
jgi:2,4-dienoyl-CoA reductase-like NADH-dependent reductase (Old Yellow Enzyme family)